MIKKTVCTICAAVLIWAMPLLMLSSFYSCSPMKAGAAVSTAANAIDKTRVEDDLDVSEYPISTTESVRVVSFSEYCFAEDLINCGNYALYVYVYYPSGKALSVRDGVHTVNMAVAYDEEGEPVRYENCALRYLSASEIGTVVKFRVVGNIDAIFSNARAMDAASGERRYDVAGVQLLEMGAAGAKDHKVAKTYLYTGYAKGYGAKDEPLSVRAGYLETISLTPQMTYYSPEGDNGKAHTYDTLYSVFFGVPNEYIEKYGDLTKIHAQWIEALTKYMYLTGTKAVYNALEEYIGKAPDDALKYGFMGNISYREEVISGGGAANYAFFYDGKYGYNFEQTLKWAFTTTTYTALSQIPSLYWLFRTPSFEANAADGYVLPAEEILAYGRDYSKGMVDLIPGTQYSRSLFDDVGELTDVTYNRDQTFTLSSYEYSENFWSVLFNSKAFQDKTENALTVSRIQRIDDCTSAAQVEEDYCVNASDYAALKGMTNRGETVYVFHFAVSDYYATECFQFENMDTSSGDYLDSNGRLFRQNMYLNFDVIDVTFTAEDGTEKVLGVIADPLDITRDSTPADDATPDPVKVYIFVVYIVMTVALAGIILTSIVKRKWRDG